MYVDVHNIFVQIVTNIYKYISLCLGIREEDLSLAMSRELLVLYPPLVRAACALTVLDQMVTSKETP
jgi:hypothetical protein